jgi:hypothetical protein
MVLCDEVELVPGDEDAFNLVGVKARIRVGSFPYLHPRLCVFLQATGHEGTASWHLELIQAGTDLELVSTPEQEVDFHGPLEIIPLWWRIEDCNFPDPGLYYVEVYFGQKLSCERLLTLSDGGVISNGQGTR